MIGFPFGSSLTVTERINTSVSVCPQILQGTLERDVTVIATTMDISAIGTKFAKILSQSGVNIHPTHNHIPLNAAVDDYMPVTGGEITFTSGQMVNNVQCISITILEDSNVLEDSESFQLTLSATEAFTIFPAGQNNIIINVNEDPLDGLSDFIYMGACLIILCCWTHI